MTVDELKSLGALTGVSLPARKAELGRVVIDYLAGSGLRRAWERLGELEQAAVAEVVHGPGTQFPSARFQAKYGCSPQWGSLGRYGRGGPASLLRLFFYDVDGERVMPSDLKARLRDFVPEPKIAEVRSSDEPTTLGASTEAGELVVHRVEQGARRELLSVLHLVDAGKVSVSDKTRRPTAKTVAAIDAVLDGGDFYASGPGVHAQGADSGGIDPDTRPGPIRSFAWPMILQAGALVELSGTKLRLTRAGRKALGDPPAVTLRSLWDKWLGTTILDELSRVECVKGQTGKGKRSLTAVSSRRAAIADTLALCPVMRWIATDDLLGYIWATDHSFAVTRNAWTLYLGEAQYGSLGYDSTGLILEERYLLCLLLEYAATLGVVDVALVAPAGAREDYGDLWGAYDLPYLSRYDGLMSIRITAFGASVLGMATDFEVAAPVSTAVLRVLPDLQVVAVGAEVERSVRMALDAFAVPVSDVVWRIDQAKLLAATDQGWSIEQIHTFLTAHNIGALPEAVARLLADVAERCGQVVDRGLVRLVECRDPALAALFANDRHTARYCTAAGDRHLVVPTSSETAFRRGLRHLGYRLASGDEP